MQFTPKTEKEVSASRFSNLPDGEYPFTVLESNEQPSKSVKNLGRIMCALKLAVHRPDGGEQWVYDYFADWFSEWKLKHFAETTGHGQDYESGALDVTNGAAVGWEGYVLIGAETDGKTGKERNVVKDYIVKQAQPQQVAKPAAKAPQKPTSAQQPEPPQSDDVPF